MEHKAWKILGSKYVLRHNGLAVRVDRCEVKPGLEFEPYVIETSSWVNVVALTGDREVVLVKQYRHAVGQALLELPAGVMDDEDASPLAAVKRELLEETGYTGSKFIHIGTMYPNPATHTNQTYSFLALDVEQTGQQSLDDTEDIDVLLAPLAEVIDMAKSGLLSQALHISALFFALAYLERQT